MKHFIFALIGLSLAGCATNPHKAVRLDTTITHSDVVSGDQRIGVKNGNMIVQKKVLMAEELRSVQIRAYELEDHVYGNDKYGSLGQYGVLKECKRQLASKANGGSGKLTWVESLDRIIPEDEEMMVGLDDAGKRLIGVSEEMLKDRITRFQGYRKVLQKRSEDLSLQQDICNAELQSNKFDMQASK